MSIIKNNDTIVAIATANGIGSISIVRLSGKDALNIALKISKKLHLFHEWQLCQNFMIQKMN